MSLQTTILYTITIQLYNTTRMIPRGPKRLLGGERHNLCYHLAQGCLPHMWPVLVSSPRPLDRKPDALPLCQRGRVHLVSRVLMPSRSQALQNVNY